MDKKFKIFFSEKFNRKIYSIFFLIYLLFLSLSCSTEKSDNIIINFWGMGAEAEYLNQLLPQFESENPGIKVKVQMIPWTAAQEKLISAYASENLPDAFQLGNTWIPQFVSLDALENLDERIEKSEIILREFGKQILLMTMSSASHGISIRVLCITGQIY